jgi:hypothetical protein
MSRRQLHFRSTGACGECFTAHSANIIVNTTCKVNKPVAPPPMWADAKWEDGPIDALLASGVFAMEVS